MDLRRGLDVSTSLLASQLRGWRGTAAFRPAKLQPEKPLELYEYEASPYCRLVREALTELDLDAVIHPCPRGGKRFRPRVQELGGRQQYPFLVDPNTGTSLYESGDIVSYVAKTYDGRVRNAAGARRGGAVGMAFLASCARGYAGFRGYRARASKAPAQPLELYSFESSPFSRLAREALCELELPYLLRNTGKGTWTDMGPPSVRDRWHKARPDTNRNRKRLFERAGQVQVPYLVDPNTGTEMFESAAIVDYLERTYAA
ncbi:MAG TPA: glutathione S-transferase N-terminal domain-containing protein [Candidatus Binatia bacterium]|nr:glutathione S-transferase N-terminal domain-containing protein [Candidatus Binatia bacterium]